MDSDLTLIRLAFRISPEQMDAFDSELAMQFGNPTPDGLLFYALELYWTRSGAGRLVSSSEPQGNWRMYDATRGLASGFVFSMLEDRDGRLWFSAFGGGVSYFDGQAFQTYTRKEGLAHNEVFDILQDRNGCFWFATEVGASRFDPLNSLNRPGRLLPHKMVWHTMKCRLFMKIAVD